MVYFTVVVITIISLNYRLRREPRSLPFNSRPLGFRKQNSEMTLTSFFIFKGDFAKILFAIPWTLTAPFCVGYKMERHSKCPIVAKSDGRWPVTCPGVDYFYIH